LNYLQQRAPTDDHLLLLMSERQLPDDLRFELLHIIDAFPLAASAVPTSSHFTAFPFQALVAQPLPAVTLAGPTEPPGTSSTEPISDVTSLW